jgi:hypothetical protein
MSQQVAAIRTPASASEVLGALVGAGVSQTAAVMLAAQSALETGGWAEMWNWNLGDITTNADYFILGSNPGHFRPSDDLQSGASDFIGYLRQHGLIPFAEANDLDGYVARLQAINYAGGADYNAYRDGMASWMGKLGGVVPSRHSTLKTAGIVIAILTVSAATAYYIVEGELPEPKRIPRAIKRGLARL